MKLHTIYPLLLLGPGMLLAVSCGPASSPDTEEPSQAHEEENSIDLDAGYQMTQEQIAYAQIVTEIAGPRTIATTLTLPAVAAKDLDEQSHVNAILPGVVVEVQAVLGEEVQPGDPMCTIRSTELAEAVANLRSSRALLAATRKMHEQEKEILERGVGIAKSTVALERKLAADGFGTARRLAEAETALQKAELARDRRLLELDQRITTEEIAVNAASARIASWGFDPAIADTDAAAEGIYRLHAEAAGVVLERHITTGEAVDSQTQLLLIQGMEEIWMLAGVFENQLRHIDEGMPAQVRFDAFPNLLIEGVVDHIHHDLEEETRSVIARVKVENRALPNRKEPHPLLPGMFGSIELLTGKEYVEIAVPADSLLQESGKDFLFTLDEDGVVRRHFVELGMRGNGEVEIRSGIDPGAKVVTQGIFVLKSMLHKEAIGGHDH